jgi:hypothetical protein
MVNHREGFTRLDDTYDAIIIDDANLHEFKETQLLSLIDNQSNKTLKVLYKAVYKTLKVLYKAVYKKPGIVQMIAMNKKELISMHAGRLYLLNPVLVVLLLMLLKSLILTQFYEVKQLTKLRTLSFRRVKSACIETIRAG